MKDPNAMTTEELRSALSDLVDRRAKLIAALVCPDCGCELPCDEPRHDALDRETCPECGLDVDRELEHGPEVQK